MIGRFTETSEYRNLFRSIDLYRILGAGLLIAIGFVLQSFVQDEPLWLHLFPMASLALAGVPIVWGAIQGLIQRKINVDELVSLAIVASVVLGEYMSAAMVAFLMGLGGLIEEFTSSRARRAIESVMESVPESVNLLINGEEKESALDEVRVNDLVRIRPGEMIPLDGEVIKGETSVDESSMTGEAMPVMRGPGDRVSSGTLNIDGCIDVLVAGSATDSTQAKIVDMIKEAEKHRAPVIRLAERYAKWFTPVILSLALITWGITGDIYRAVTILIVGCPCALVLATPTAVVAALGRAFRQGVLLKGGKYLEVIRHVDIVAFDKTGTLTEGRAVVVGVWTKDGMSEQELIREAASIESGSEHPLGRAVVNEAKARKIRFEDRSTETSAVRGLGIRAGDMLVGSRSFIENDGIEVDAECRAYHDSATSQGRTVLVLARKGTVIGAIALADRMRDESEKVVNWANQQGMHTMLLSGDQEAPSRSAGRAVGVKETRAAMMPGEKLSYIRKLQSEGHSVAYVGDGTNDGPALAESRIGISLASRRNNVALETADAVLMHQGLGHLPFLFELGRATGRVINQNLILFGLAFNAAMLALSAYGVLTPIPGALAHNIGSVAVVLNSARLLRTPYTSP